MSDQIFVLVFTENIIAKQALNLEYLMLVSAIVALLHHVNVVVLFCASKQSNPKEEDKVFKMISFKTKHSLPLEEFPSIKLHPIGRYFASNG